MAVEKPLRFDQVQDYGYRPKNLLTNGGFEVWQRGAGPFVFPTMSGGYTADEWLTVLTSDTITVSRSSASKTGNYCIRTQSVGTASPNLLQGLENWKSLEGLTLTFSVWVKSSIAGKAGVGILDWNGSTFDSGGSPFNSQANVWERLTAVKTVRTGLVYPGAAAPPHGYPLWVSLGVLPGADTYFDGATCVVGNYPEGVPFHPLTPHEDLARCQRYYQSFKNFGMSAYMIATTGSYIFTMPFPVPMPTGIVLTPVKTAEVRSGVTTSGSIVVNAGILQSYRFTILNGTGSPGMGGINWDFNLALP